MSSKYSQCTFLKLTYEKLNLSMPVRFVKLFLSRAAPQGGHGLPLFTEINVFLHARYLALNSAES